jgi:hypothetical protein
MNKPILPEKPVDGYTVTWFEVYKDVYSASVSEHKAVFHVNTKWDDFAPDRKGGVDIVNDWMCYTRGHADGRMCGWYSILDWDWKDDYATRKEALKAAIDYCTQRIKDLYKHIDSLNEYRSELEKEWSELS